MDMTQTIPVDQPIIADRLRWKKYALRSLIWLAVAAFLAVCAVGGWNLRRWVFDATDPIRFQDDERRGTFWGLQTIGPEGFLNQYTKMAPEIPEWQDSRWTPWLDYSPLRLLVMRQWAAWRQHWFHLDPSVALMDAWQRDYAFNKFVLMFNATLESLSAILAFLLTWYWVRRGTSNENRRHFTGVWQGACAALFIWFSPDIIINAHAWVQWDTWVIPWYLAGCLLASLDWWFAAGVVIAIGCNLKGQMFPITPIFLIWPLVQGRIGAALRWLCGAVFSYALIVSPWLLSHLPADQLAAARSTQEGLTVTDYPPDLFAIHRIFERLAVIWITEMLLLVGSIPWILRTLTPEQSQPADSRLSAILQSQWLWLWSSVTLIIICVAWPIFLPQNRPIWYVGLMAGGAVAALALLLRPRAMPYLLAAITGVGLFSCVWLFQGDSSWYDCAVHFGSIHWPYLITGPTSNVPAIFENRFNWPREVDQVAFTLPALHGHWPAFITRQGWWPALDTDITSKVLFNSIYGVFLLISGIAIGIQTRRNDRRALVAFVTPWIMMFIWPVQMQERYLLYGAAASACCIGESIGAALLGLLLTLFSLMMSMKCLFDAGWSNAGAFGENLASAVPWLFSPDSGNTMHQYLGGTQPDIAWGVLVVGFVFLYLSLTPSRRRRADTTAAQISC